ncbi:hypothetical protein AVEN_265645-1, partial [Araneus ventricosus]
MNHTVRLQNESIMRLSMQQAYLISDIVVVSYRISTSYRIGYRRRIVSDI